MGDFALTVRNASTRAALSGKAAKFIVELYGNLLCSFENFLKKMRNKIKTVHPLLFNCGVILPFTFPQLLQKRSANRIGCYEKKLQNFSIIED